MGGTHTSKKALYLRCGCFAMEFIDGHEAKGRSPALGYLNCCSFTSSSFPGRNQLSPTIEVDTVSVCTSSKNCFLFTLDLVISVLHP